MFVDTLDYQQVFGLSVASVAAYRLVKLAKQFFMDLPF